MQPTIAASLRFGCGALILLLWLGLSGHGFRLSTRSWVSVVSAGGLGIFVFNELFFWGFRLAPSIDGSLTVPVLSPVLTTAGSVLLLREHAAPARLAGLAVGVSGAVVFLLGVSGSASGKRLAGDLIFVAGAAVWSGYTLLGRRILAGIEPVKAIALATAASALMLAAVAAPHGAGRRVGAAVTLGHHLGRVLPPT